MYQLYVFPEVYITKPTCTAGLSQTLCTGFANNYNHVLEYSSEYTVGARQSIIDPLEPKMLIVPSRDDQQKLFVP